MTMEEIKPSDSLDESQHSIGGGSAGGLLFDEELFSVFDDEDDPPVSWHNEEFDKQHRHAMIQEIARLLQARKKAVPSPEWMLQLPHKARKLESRLYKGASSLEDYLDRTTLKPRLQKLAKSIVREFTSQSKLAKKKAPPNETSLPNPSDTKAPPAVASDPSASTTPLPIPNTVATVPQTIPGSMPVSRNSSISSKNSISEIERQKAVNAKLQEEIMDNIRRQQEMVRRLQTTGDGTMNNNNSLGSIHNPQQLMQNPLPSPLSMASGAMQQNDLSNMLRRHSGSLQFSNDMLRRHSGNLQLNTLMSDAMLKNRLPVMPGPSAAGLAPPNFAGFAAGLPPNPAPFSQSLQQHQQLQFLRNSLLGNSNPVVLEAMQAAQQSMGGGPLPMPPNNLSSSHPSSNGRNSNSNNTSLPGDAPLSPNSFNW